MITVNLQELLNKISTSETKDVLANTNFAVVDNPKPVTQETNNKKSYYENIQKIKNFINTNTGYDQDELKKLQNLCSAVVKSPHFNYNDLGKKVIKTIVQNKFFDLLAILLEKHFNSIDDESLCVALYELLNLEDDLLGDDAAINRQYQEKMTQDNALFRTFYDACTDLLTFPEDNAKYFQKYFLIYAVCLLCQKPMDKVSFMKALLKLEESRIQHLLEIFYFLVVPLNSEATRLGIQVSQATIYEYISWTLSCTYEKIKDSKNIQRVLALLSKALTTKQEEAKMLDLLNNFSNLSEKKLLKLESVDLRKNLNVEEFYF